MCACDENDIELWHARAWLLVQNVHLKPMPNFILQAVLGDLKAHRPQSLALFSHQIWCASM